MELDGWKCSGLFQGETAFHQNRTEVQYNLEKLQKRTQPNKTNENDFKGFATQPGHSYITWA